MAGKSSGEQKKVDFNGKPYHMECVIYYGKDSEKYFRDFDRKKAALLRDDLSKLSDEDLMRLHEMLVELIEER